jgi:C4-dicarboxylate-specific signal transduction histidine kinase
MGLFSNPGFMPHIHCYLDTPALVATMFTTDMLIGLAYVSISVSLYLLVKKINLPFSFMFLAFGLFIAACGATHFMEVYTLWYPAYWAAALVKFITATASVVTAILLFPLAPKVVRLAETAKLAEQNRLKLQKTNEALEIKSAELAKTNQLLKDQQKIMAHSAKMSALGEMAGGIAHEINSPLGIITVRANQLERLLSRDQLSPEIIKREAQLIASTALRIGEIIKGLRAFAREGDKDPFEIVSVKAVIHDVLVLCQTKFKNYDIDLRINYGPDDLKIECRPVQIGQVILNLLNNSFDAVSALKEKWVLLEVAEQNNFITFSVTDSGGGISKEILPRIMEPFFTTKEVGKGTGLGLSISKGIAESHRGTLYLDTEAPNTRFVLGLPKACNSMRDI